MKMPMKYTPVFLTISLVIVFMAMLMVQNMQPEKEYLSISFEHSDRLNQPGPPDTKKQKKVVYEGNPVFLKEDVRDEDNRSKGNIQLIGNSTSPDEESAWINQKTKEESGKHVKGKAPYLVLGGSYTDNMILLSKQAQYENKGVRAEIIKFKNKKARHICLGRFKDKADAKQQAQQLASQLDIRTYVFDRAKKRLDRSH